MCIAATGVTATYKKLMYVITKNSYPIERIEALPHYQDFLAAGWTTGY